MQRHLYPKNWEAIARQIKEAADWTCQQCGRPCRRPSETQEQLIDRLADDFQWAGELFDLTDGGPLGPVAKLRAGRFVLTVAHLNHRPEDCRPENLRALCTVCHCRMDIAPGAIATKRAIALERRGQLNLFGANQ